METNYLRGAFIAYDPDVGEEGKRTIPFRFNPENLSRQVSVEKGEGAKGSGGAAGGADPEKEASSDTGGMTKESFNVLIRVDSDDRNGDGHEAARNLPEELGVLPELAALEDLLHPTASPVEAAGDGSEPVEAKPRRPTVLFIWGRKRVLPVRITGLAIEETSYNRHLNPTRAEIDVSLEVLGEADAKDNVHVQSALEFMHGTRRQLAQMFLDNTAAQNSNVLPY